MDKYDYITATIDEEKVRLEKIIDYLKKENNNDDIIEYQERYNNIVKYLNAKEKYKLTLKSINEAKSKLEELNNNKDECEVDNILLEDTLLSKFNEDTNNKYRNLLYENIKYEEESIRDILYLVFEKDSNYLELVNKRKRLFQLLNKDNYPKTYNTLVSQDILIKKQASLLDEIFIVENSIKVLEDELRKIEDSIMTLPILKILYEFWIIDSYDKNKVNRSKLFLDNRNFVNIKNDIDKKEEMVIDKEVVKKDYLIPDLKLPGIDEDTKVSIDGKKYIKNDE